MASEFVAVNCAALPDSLVESALFGHRAGAFTGATETRDGVFAGANGGTLFLYEIAELSPAAQAKLLRAIESGRFAKVGDVAEQAVDVRVVAATHRDLPAEVDAGRFRQDLYFRLAAARLVLPPLRDRPAELPLLARAFLASASEAMGIAPLHLSDDAMVALTGHTWPGNARELRNAMEVAAASADGEVVEPWHLPPPMGDVEEDRDVPREGASAESADGFRSLPDEVRELETTRIRAALDAADGVHARAAALLDMPRRTFAMKAKRYGLA